MEKSSKPLGSIKYEDALPLVNAYRNDTSISNPTFLFWHGIKEFSSYIEDVIEKYTDQVDLSDDDCSWQLGFVPMYITDEAEKIRLITCFVPTIVENSNPKAVHDYFQCREANNDFYKNYYKPLEDLMDADGIASPVFDEGQLWP